MAIRYTLYAAYECPICGKVALSEPVTGFRAEHLQNRLEMTKGQDFYSDGTCADCIASVIELPADDLAPVPAGRGF